MMRVVDILYAFPFMNFVILLNAVLSKHPTLIALDEKMRDSFARQFPLQIEMAILDEITRPYDPDQMAGSVWLYLREEARAQK